MKRTAVVVVACLSAALAPAAHAGLVSALYNVDFSSPSESFWGPGQSAASFHYNQLILGNTSFGMRFETGASTGTVSSNYNGSISVGYDNQVSPGLVDLSLAFTGDPNGGHFQTLLGAFVDVTAYFPSPIGAVTVTNPNYSLQTGSTYTPSPPDSPSGSDSFTPAQSTIGPSVPGITGQAGIDYDIVQHSTHSVSALNGSILATHAGDGQTRIAPFSLASAGDVMLDLDLPGLWTLQLTTLSLGNLFSTHFDLAIVPFVQYVLGINCGDPGTNADNGFGCLGDDRLDTSLASFTFYRNHPFALDMTSADALASFQIDVLPSQSVPEPATIALLGLGLAGLGVSRRAKPRR